VNASVAAERTDRGACRRITRQPEAVAVVGIEAPPIDLQEVRR